MRKRRRNSVIACAVAIAVGGAIVVRAQQPPPQKYEIGVMSPGGPPPRLADGHVDFTGHWFPNGAGQGVSGRYGVDPAATRQFDPKITPKRLRSSRPGRSRRSSR